MQKYNHINLSQRYCIQKLIQDKKSQTEISRVLRSTISSELKRNVGKRGRGAKTYCADNAFRMTKGRHVNKPKLFRLTDALKRDARMWLHIERLSPEPIAARWRMLGVAGVCHETLYNWIWDAKKSKHRNHIKDNMLYLTLRHG
tara:strand:- start:2696 stop:3127 length:432 start_codon:yes stop_codon:yes gene_type:complete